MAISSVAELLSEADLAAIAPVRELVTEGDRRQQKGFLQAYVQEIKVVSREEIYPFPFVTTVRPLSSHCSNPGAHLGSRGRAPAHPRPLP
jgi:hypothetical protein